MCATLRARRPPPLPAPALPSPAVTEPAAQETRRPSTPRANAVAPLPPIIDSITVEKDEVCEGEENLVTVRAHTPDDNDAFLHYQIGSTRGSPVALRSYLDDREKPSWQRITVFGKNNVATSAEMPPFRVKRCGGDAPAVVIEHRLLPNTLAEFEFAARVVRMGTPVIDGGAAPSFRPRRFVWSFGDGAREESQEPRRTHDFAARPRDTLYSHFLVTVKVTGEDGRELEGRHALELLNPAFEAYAYKGTVVVFAELDPRFPVLSASGVVDQGVRLWHTRRDVLSITKVAVTTRRSDGQRSPTSYPPVGSLLGSAVIPPGRGLEIRVALDTRAEPDTLSRDYFLEGQTPDGHPVRGSFSVMRPPLPPSKERHVPINDPALVAKVKLAREVLHREYVTDEDLWQLERAGQFDGLKLDAGAAPRP
jgi:hypothetical protein